MREPQASHDGQPERLAPSCPMLHTSDTLQQTSIVPPTALCLLAAPCDSIGASTGIRFISISSVRPERAQSMSH